MSFKTEDEANKNSSEDNFGLPDLEYKPLDQLNETAAPATEHQQESPLMEETSDESMSEESVREERAAYVPQEPQPASKAPLIIAVLIGLVVLVAGFLVWKYVIEPSNQKEKIEQLAKEKKKKEDADQARLAQQRAEEERQRLASEAAAKAKPAEGTVESLTAPTGRYYVVIASAVDGDLVMDYAKKLSAKGVGSKIIPPFGKWKFNRLAIGDHDSYAAAQSAADAVKGEYGSAVWVVRY
jgi:cytoskeletal protein RodZ